MEARIFMKFETYNVHKIELDHQPNFHKDPCKDARALAMKCARAQIFTDLYENLVGGQLLSYEQIS